MPGIGRLDNVSAAARPPLARLRSLSLTSLPTTASPRWLFGTVCLAAAALLFLATALTLGVLTLRMQSANHEADNATEILRESGRVAEAIIAFNGTSRVYLNLREPNLLHERDLTKKSIAEQLSHLRRHVATYPALAHAVEDAFTLEKRQIALFDHLIAATDQPGVAITEGEADRLKNTKAINAAFVAIGGSAAETFGAAQQHLSEDLRLAMVTALMGGIAAPLFGLLGIHLLRDERTTRRTRELHRELMHVQRLAIMGDTSEMLVHEITQALTAASQYQTALRRKLEAGAFDHTQEWAEKIGEQYQRASLLVKRLRRFIEKREAGKSTEPPSVLIEDAIALLGTRDSTVTLKTQIDPEVPVVMVDRVQVQQVLVNLIRNAIEAMTDQERRQILISATAQGHHHAAIAIADTGPGLPPAVAARLFEPLASAKPQGRGIGLSICQDIIRDHGGTISAEANPGGGTIFRFTLPISREPVATA